MATGKPSTLSTKIDISSFRTFSEIKKEYKATRELHDQPKMQTSGMVPDRRALGYFYASVYYFNRMTKERRLRLERALHTFVVAEEIGTLVNPQTKDTVVASLYLSAINQLAESPKNCSHTISRCPVCGKSDIQHQTTSHTGQIEALMREYFTGKQLKSGIKFIKKSYHNVRSLFLHEGKLSGNELNEYDWGSPTYARHMEDLVNYQITCRRLLQLFIQKDTLQNERIKDNNS